MKRFWEVIIDDDKLTIEVIGMSSDDTLLTNNVVAMQKAGMHVRCTTPDISASKNEILISGYRNEDNLYSRLLTEYEQKTHKQLKRW